MRFIEPLSENYVIAHFLKHEVESERFGGAICQLLKQDNQPRSLIDNPDLENADENLYRTKP